MVRSNAEVKSNLPLFDVTPSKDFPEYLLVRCPKEDCPSHTKGEVRPFLVHKRTWVRPRKSMVDSTTVIVGRVCPYCSRTSRKP